MHDDLLVLCYHAVSPSWPAELSVTPDELDRQLAELVRRGYRGARFGEALGAHGRGEGLSDEGHPGGRRDRSGHRGRVASVTFDDAYRSVLDLAKPILDRYGFPGTVFVVTDWPGRAQPMHWPGIDGWLGSEHERELGALDWDELRALADAGWEIGSHTCSHPHLTRLDDARLASELRDSKALIAREVGGGCDSLAYPYGDMDARVLDAARAAGYRWACTIPRVLSAPHALSWPRAPIYHDDDMRRFAAKVSPTLRRLRASRIGGSLDRARVRLADQKSSA